MAFKKLGEVLGSKNKVEFEFIDVISDEAQRDGSPLVRFVTKVIPVVMGRRIRDNVTGESATLEANDVEMVTIGKETLEKIEALQEEWKTSGGKTGEQVIEWGVDGKSGTFSSKTLKFDVSQNLEVFVVIESFSVFGRKQRAARQQTQRQAVMDKINSNKTKKEFKDENMNSNVPEATKEADKGKPEVIEEVKGQRKPEPVK